MLSLLGPTASGKTALGVQLALRLGGELLSADSRQVYRGMDVGTGKDLGEYVHEGQQVAYHLIDLVPAGEQYNLFAWQQAFHSAYSAIRARGHLPILCGGTGLYAESVLKGYQLPDVAPNEALRAELRDLDMPALRQRLESYGPLHNVTDLDSPLRAIRAIEIADYIAQHRGTELEHSCYPAIASCILCLDLERSERRARITRRLRQRLEQEDMLGEVQRLLDNGVSADTLMRYGLEYRFLTQHLLGQLSYEEMYSALETAIHQFAKRQMTWFRGMERRGFTLHYIDALQPRSQQLEQALEHWERWQATHLDK